MTDYEKALFAILKIGHETSMRGTGISLNDALVRARYKDLRAGFCASDLVPLIEAYPTLVGEWVAYSDDKRTDGWYLSEQGEIGLVGEPESREQFDSIPEAVATFVVRELDLAMTLLNAKSRPV